MAENMRWPAPLLQPDKKKDCLLYSTAYLCHCLGYPDVTVEQVRQYRTETGWYEASFPSEHLSVQAEHWWHYTLQKSEYQRFWLGGEQRGWVEQHLAEKQIALASVHRVPEMGHIVVLLEADEESVTDARFTTKMRLSQWKILVVCQVMMVRMFCASSMVPSSLLVVSTCAKRVNGGRIGRMRNRES
jgi:hypothetical protein